MILSNFHLTLYIKILIIHYTGGIFELSKKFNYFFYGSSPTYPKSITKNFRIDKCITLTLSVTEEKFMLIWRKEK